MIKKRSFLSLNFKLSLSVVLALIIGLFLFFVFSLISETIINKYYLTDEAISKRNVQNIKEFSKYITENQLSSTDTKNITEWTKQKRNIYLVLYKNNEIIYESDWSSGENGDYVQNPERNISPIDGETLPPIINDINVMDYSQYPVKFANGTFVVAIKDLSANILFNAILPLCALLSFIVFLLLTYMYNSKVTRKIVRLENEVKKIESEDINSIITVPGNDEIALLARDVDKMRNTIITQLTEEQLVWKANSDLVTAMAHDIRTPLTVLNGYLNIVKQKEYSSDEELEKFIKISCDKAIQLKDLSDKLFEYFFVFGKFTQDIKLEKLDASVLFQQLIGEHSVLLQDQGFRFEISMFDEKVFIFVDVMQIKRLFDNLFSNIEKYADKAVSISISAEVEGEYIHVIFENKILNAEKQAESTKIGLLTCDKIIKEMGGKFSAKSVGDKFYVKIRININNKSIVD